MTITDEMVERALNATTEELPEGVQYALIRGLNAMGWEIAITGSHDVMHAALTAALEGREEPDATAAYMAGFERGKEAAGAAAEPVAWAFAPGQHVEKWTGEALWEGVVVARYLTTKGKERYVVEVQPQGFQMIAVPSQLRAAAIRGGADDPR